MLVEDTVESRVERRAGRSTTSGDEGRNKDEEFGVVVSKLL